MLIIKRLLVFIYPLLLILGFGIIFYYPLAIYWLPLILVLILAAIVWELNGRTWQKKFWHFLINPGFFVLSLFFFIIFIDQLSLKWLVAILGAIFAFLILDNLFTFFYQPGRYQPYSLENTSGYVNVITAFLFFSSLYSAIVFLSMRAYWLIPLAFLAVWLLSYQSIIIHQIGWPKGWLYVIINSLIITELFWVTSYLPTGFYVNGAIVAIAHYFIIGLSCSWLLNKLEKRTIKRYILAAIISLVIILGTARWL